MFFYLWVHRLPHCGYVLGGSFMARKATVKLAKPVVT